MPSSASRRRRFARWFVFWLAAGLLFSILNPTRIWGEIPRPLVGLARSALWFVQYSLVLGVLAWVIEQLRRRLPLVEGPRRNLYAHATFSVIFALLHPGITALLFVIENPHLPDGLRFRTDLGDGLPRFFHHELLFYWLILAIGEAVAYDRRARGQRVAHHNLERQLARARLSALEMQLHPHFLYNTLNSIAELVYQSPAGADQALVRLATLLDRVHHPFAGQLVTLRAEVEFLEQYLELEKLRFEERLDLRLDFPAPLLGLRVPSLILQPLVENAVRHGAARIGRRSVLSVAAYRAGQMLVVEIENEMPPREPAASPGGRAGGLGLVNTSARLRQIYGDRARLTIAPVDDSRRFAVRLELPLSFYSTPEAAGAPPAGEGAPGWTAASPAR